MKAPAYPYIERHGNGWRAWAKFNGRRTRGPKRSTPAQAHEDALEMRCNAGPGIRVHRVLR